MAFSLKKQVGKSVSISNISEILDKKRIEAIAKKAEIKYNREFQTARELFDFLAKNPAESFPQAVEICKDKNSQPVYAWLALEISLFIGFRAKLKLYTNKEQAKKKSVEAQLALFEEKNKAKEREALRGGQPESKTFALAPIIAAFKERNWAGGSIAAQQIFELVEKHRNDLDAFTVDELQGIVSDDPEKINKMFAEKGINLSISQTKPDSLFFCGVMDIAVKWIKKGEISDIDAQDGNKYPGVLMSDMNSFSVLRSGEKGHKDVLVLSTKNGDQVCIAECPEEPISNFEAFMACHKLQEELGALHEGDWEVKFPMISLEQNEPIDLIGGYDIKTDEILLQSLMRNVFEMDEEGAIAKSAFAAESVPMSVGWVSGRRRWTIDVPCLIWIKRQDVPFPVFGGWFSYKNWENPKKI